MSLHLSIFIISLTEPHHHIQSAGQPLHISAAYSGRIACAYKCGRSFTRPKGGSSTNTTNTGSSTDARFVNLCVCVYECESTGGAEWLLEDTIPLRNVSLPRVGVCADTQIDLSYLHDTSFMQKRQRLTQVCAAVPNMILRTGRFRDSLISIKCVSPLHLSRNSRQ